VMNARKPGKWRRSSSAAKRTMATDTARTKT
jgi:hypothetical protein